MTQSVVDVGVQGNDGSGDSLYESGNKINDNFLELFARPSVESHIRMSGNLISSSDSNADITLEASGTGHIVFPAISFIGNNITGTRSNEDLVISASGSGKVVIGSVGFSGATISSSDSSIININEGLIVDGTLLVTGASSLSGAISGGTGSTLGNLTLANGSITDSSGALSFGNENLTTTGTLTAATGSTLGNLTLANGSITDSSGAISFGNENLTTTGTMSAETGSTIGNLTLADGSITDSGGSISFGNENLSTTGTVTVGNLLLASASITDSSGAISFGNENLTSTGTINSGTGSTIGNLTLGNGSITDSGGSIDFGNENLSTTGTFTLGTMVMAAASITDTSGAISFGNENLSTTGTLGAGATTVDAITVSGTVSMAGTVNIDNLNFNDNIISSDSNADILVTPGGTGTVLISNLTVDSSINITDNEITGLNSNQDLIISPSGTGSVIMSKVDINEGTIDNTVIGATTPLAGTFTTLSATTSAVIDGVTISDNQITTNASNSNLELSGNGSGSVTISGFTFPTSDGTDGQFLKTDGAGTLAFATAGASLSVSTIADATTTVATSTASVLNTFAAATFRSAKYFISITDATNSRFEIVEANVTHDGTNAYIAVFGSTTDHTGPLTSFTADIDSGNVRVLVTNTSSDSTVFRFQRLAVNV